MKKALLALLIACVAATGQAQQILLPAGSVKTIVTAEETIYDETGIYFTLRGMKVTSLKYSLVSDSLPPQWFVMACMYGECIGGTPGSGQFQNLLKGPDTTGFVKFHFGFNGQPGRGIIRYQLYSESPLDTGSAIITFDVTHTTPTGMPFAETASELTAASPQPGQLWLQTAGACRVAILAMDGRVVYFGQTTAGQALEMHLPPGVYAITAAGKSIKVRVN